MIISSRVRRFGISNIRKICPDWIKYNSLILFCWGGADKAGVESSIPSPNLSILEVLELSFFELT